MDAERNEKMKELLEYAESKFICPGEIQVLCGKIFNCQLKGLPTDRIDEFKQWLIHNSFRVFQVLEPEKHEALMQINSNDEKEEAYKKWFLNEERKHQPVEQVF